MTNKTQSAGLQWQALTFSIFKFFASLKLAILLLVSLMIIMAAGTIIESLHGTDAARLTIYETHWFSFVLFILAMNVASATIDRIPWKVKHIGFVITHAGILTILLGSFVTQQFMIDGQMVLEEGETDYRITLPEPLVYVFSEDSGRDWIVPFKRKPFVWEGNKKLAEKSAAFPFSIKLLSYYPKAYVEESLTKSDVGPGAIKIHIHNSFINQSLQLIENDEALGRVQMGPAIFSFSKEPLKEQTGEVSEAGYLEFIFGEKNFRVPLDEAATLPVTYEIEGSDYKVIVEKIFKNAVVDGKELIEHDSEEKKNPAVQLVLIGKDFEEKHTTFSNFPDFPTTHGMKESVTGGKIFYRMPNSGSRGETHELRFVRKTNLANPPPKARLAPIRSGQSPTPDVQYQVQNGFEVTTHDLELDKDISLGWMDLKFRVEEYFEHSSKKRIFDPAPNTTMSEDATSAIRLNISGEELWLAQGILETLEIEGKTYHFLYGQKRMPIDFRLELKDFRMEKYPGTNQPASFESDVVLKDDARGIREELTISMNEPLEHQGFKVYQSGYTMEPGEPEVSIFSIGRDPGIPFKYIGTIIMVIGIVSMFFTRKFSTRAGTL